MDKEKEIEKEIEELTAHIQKAFDVVNEKFGRDPCAETIASNLRLHRYRREDIVEKETAKEIYERVDKWLDEIVPHTREETILICLLGWIKTRFGVEVDE